MAASCGSRLMWLAAVVVLDRGVFLPLAGMAYIPDSGGGVLGPWFFQFGQLSKPRGHTTRAVSLGSLQTQRTRHLAACGGQN